VSDLEKPSDAGSALHEPPLENPGEPQENASAALHQRLDELRSLADGWLDGENQPPSDRVITALQSIVDMLAGPHLPLVHIYPTPEGGVQLEWRSGTKHVARGRRMTGVFHGLQERRKCW
jgi:hypothetical protein